MDLKLGHHAKDGIEVIDVQGEIDMYTAPRLRELLIDLAVVVLAAGGHPRIPDLRHHAAPALRAGGADGRPGRGRPRRDPAVMTSGVAGMALTVAQTVV